MNLRDNSISSHLDLLRKEKPEIENLLSVYPEEYIETLLANREKIDKALKAFNSISSYSMINITVMQCNIKTCPYKSSCILLKSNIAPDGYNCPVEMKLVLDLETEVIYSLKIDKNNPIEMELLWDLIDAKLIDMRASGFLKDGAVTLESTIMIGKNECTKVEPSPAIELKLEIKKLKHSIIDQFLATRRAKKKYGMSNDDRSIEQILRDEINRSKDSD